MWANEIDSYCADWLRNLFPGITVDERSIVELGAADVRGDRCHFFAGIGGWEYALEFAGWPADRGVWTGSCPCQPLSSAGLKKGHADERHLWPALFALIAERRPPTIFGEQVASKLGREWIAGVRADLEDIGYAVGVADLCAASVGAAHIRQRLFWVADASPQRRERRRNRGAGWWPEPPGSGGLDDAPGARSEPPRVRSEGEAWNDPRVRGPKPRCETRGGLALSQVERPEGRSDASEGLQASADRFLSTRSGQPVDPWRDAEWIACLDGKARRIEPGLEPLAHGIPGRVGRLRAYGNAIVPQVAAAFIGAFLEAEGMNQ